VYDAFGLTAPTLQGADCLAAKLGCLVIVPDYFKGEPASLGWIPPDTDEKKVHYQKFMSEKALSPDNYPALIQSAADAKATFSNVQSWGVLGLCWGGKVCLLNSEFSSYKIGHPRNSRVNGELISPICSWLRLPLVPERPSKSQAKCILRGYSESYLDRHFRSRSFF